MNATLLKVIALARHGNRAPNSQFRFICPRASSLMAEFGPKSVFSRQRAALSPVGMAENTEAGVFLDKRYKTSNNNSLLSKGPYYDDGSVFFFSERMDRNVVSTLSVTRGMYPPGTGPKGVFSSEDGRGEII